VETFGIQRRQHTRRHPCLLPLDVYPESRENFARIGILTFSQTGLCIGVFVDADDIIQR